MRSSTTIRLKKGKEPLIRHGHPWVFSGAIDAWDGPKTCGVVAEVVSHNGTWLARGLAHPDTALAVRLYTRNPDESLDAILFAQRIDRAVALREAVFPVSDTAVTNAYRLVFSEADGLSGLIVDRYADTLSVRIGSRALLGFLPDILTALRSRTGLSHVHLSTDADSVQREGLTPELLAPFAGEASTPVHILEHGYQFQVDTAAGQKTGFFLDQRENRKRVASYAANREMLSAYCYTGAFEVYAAAAGATRVTGIDTSAPAIEAAEIHLDLNKLTVPREYLRADVTQTLRRFRDAGRSFDLVVLDPPRFVANRAQLEKGLRAYKDINLWALKLLRPGGILATFSCSGLVSEASFLDCVKWAAVDAGRQVRIVETLGQPADHPILPVFPESRYLKGLIVWAD